MYGIPLGEGEVGYKEGRGLFSCHFTTVSSPSEPPEQESGARGKVGPPLEWVVDLR